MKNLKKLAPKKLKITKLDSKSLAKIKGGEIMTKADIINEISKESEIEKG